VSPLGRCVLCHFHPNAREARNLSPINNANIFRGYLPELHSEPFLPAESRERTSRYLFPSGSDIYGRYRRLSLRKSMGTAEISADRKPEKNMGRRHRRHCFCRHRSSRHSFHPPDRYCSLDGDTDRSHRSCRRPIQ